jgi:MerR family transcriptional regulator, heat shock protein HspR
LYGISVAAELVGVQPPNLRLYEAKGLLNPARSQGRTRRYSDNDLARLCDIVRLLDAGLNLAGVEMVFELQAANEQLRQEIERLTNQDADS